MRINPTRGPLAGPSCKVSRTCRPARGERMPVSTAPQWRDLPSPYDAAAAARGIESWAETLAALEDRALARRLKTLTLTAAARKSGAAKSNARALRSEEHTSELQSLMRTPYAVFCLKKK